MVHRGLLVCGVVGCSLRLVAVDDLLHPGGQGLLQPPGLGREGRQAGARAGQNEAGQSARAAQGVLQGEPTALGVTEHVDVVEPQGIAHGGDLLDKGGHGPQHVRKHRNPLGAVLLPVRNERSTGDLWIRPQVRG